jgi:monoamine oxidase
MRLAGFDQPFYGVHAMSRSDHLHRLQGYLQIALHCEKTGQPTQEALDQFRHTAQLNYKRRRLLAATGAGIIAASALPHTMRTAFAAPSIGSSVAIVGAGLAGLSCGYALAGKGVRADLFEASGRAGGRCYSLHNFFPGQVAERGGEFIDTTHVTMRGYANAFGLTLEDVTKEPGDTAYFFNGQHYTEAQVVEELRAFVPALQADMRKLSPPTADSFTADDKILDYTNLKDYLATRGAGPLIRKVLDVAYTIEYGLDIEQQSCLNLLLFIHADRRAKFRPFGVFSDERFHVVEGNDRIAKGLADSLPGQIAYEHKLVKVRKLADGRIRLTFSNNGKTVETEHYAVVLTLPFSVLRDVELDASLGLPAWKRYAIDNFGYGTNSKMMLGFSGRPWYQLYNSNGSSYSDLVNHQNTWETNAIRATANAVLTDYSGGRRGALLNPNNVQAEAARFLQDLDKVYPNASAYTSKDRQGQLRVHLENWSLNPLTKGSYSCNRPGYFTTIANNEAKPVDNLLFAGEHTSSFYEWQGFMEGAALSGVRAAGEALAILRGR